MENYESQIWASPMGHPSAVTRSKLLPQWIAWAFDDSPKNPKHFNPQSDRGVVFLYNISFETFKWNRFKTTWLNNYAFIPGTRKPSYVDRIHLIVPYHPAEYGEGQPYNKLAHWLNGNWLLNLANFIKTMTDPDDIEATKTVLRKTWVSMVSVPEEREKSTVLTYGDYSFAFYMGVPKGFCYDKLYDHWIKIANECGEELHKDRDTIVEETELAYLTRLLLAAGFEEPFSRSDGGFFQYELLLSFAPREWPSFNLSECALRTHIRLFSRLWSERSSPLSLKTCKPLQNLPIARLDKAIRMDAFLAWITVNLRKGTRNKKTEWRLAPHKGPNKISISKNGYNTSGYELLSKFPEWQEVFSRYNEVFELISDLTELRLSEYALIESTHYYRRKDILKLLRSSFITPLEKYINDLKQPTALPDGQFCCFLVAGDTGSGKTKMLEEVAPIITPNCSKILKVSYKTEQNITEIMEKYKHLAKEKNEPYILVLDEFHNVNELGDICKRLYNEFNEIQSQKIPLICVLITSYGEGNINLFKDLILNAKTNKGEKAPKDFWSRLEAKLVYVPGSNTTDELLRIAAVAEVALPDDTEIFIEKLALSYLLFIRPWDTNRGPSKYETIFKEKNKIIRINDLRPTRPELLPDWQEFSTGKYSAKFASNETLKIIL